MEAMPLYIDETGGLSIAQLAARARRLKRQRGLDLLVIDYIQLLSGSNRRSNAACKRPNQPLPAPWPCVSSAGNR